LPAHGTGYDLAGAGLGQDGAGPVLRQLEAGAKEARQYREANQARVVMVNRITETSLTCRFLPNHSVEVD